MTKLSMFCIDMFIKHAPLCCVMAMSYTDKLPIEILHVFDNKGRNITPRVKLYINFYWDADIGRIGGFLKSEDVDNVVIVYVKKSENKNYYDFIQGRFLSALKNNRALDTVNRFYKIDAIIISGGVYASLSVNELQIRNILFGQIPITGF